MTNEKFAALIQALTQAGINAYGQDPIVPYEMLITDDDFRFADVIHVNLTLD